MAMVDIMRRVADAIDSDNLSMRSGTTGISDTRTHTGSRSTAGSSSMQMSLDGTPAPSVYSYQSSRDGRAMLRELAGRAVNSTNDLYLLPAGAFILHHLS